MSTHTRADPRSFTDIHVHVREGAEPADVDVSGSLLFPGAVSATEEHASLLRDMAAAAKQHKKADFMVKVDDVFFRVRRDDYAVDGTWYRFRRMAAAAPELESLRLKHPQLMRDALLAGELTSGGLIMIAGSPGSGKTTTGCATIVSRLKQHGGVAFTVEDPVELPLNGRHGRGYCSQSEVAGESGRDWVESMRGVLRSQPVGTPLILYVGEIRDADAARIMLRAASNGFLVICTSFGSDIITALDTILKLVGAEYCPTLGDVLRIVLHQSLRDDRLSVDMLCSDGPSSRVAAIIRQGIGQLPQLRNEIQIQRNEMIMSAGQANRDTRPAPLIATSRA